MNIIGVKFKIFILTVCVENVTVRALINGQAGPTQNVHFVSDNRPFVLLQDSGTHIDTLSEVSIYPFMGVSAV